MKRKDRYLIAVLLLTAGISALIMQIGKGQNGDTVVITVNGQIYGIYPLQKNQVISVHQECGYNQVYIENGKVRMNEADCPDEYCIRQGEISRENETIVCLPHKLVVEIDTEKKTKESVDIISK
ncbi:MAG: NusG domain II-containing protein [Oliverpabstia sp.]